MTTLTDVPVPQKAEAIQEIEATLPLKQIEREGETYWATAINVGDTQTVFEADSMGHLLEMIGLVKQGKQNPSEMLQDARVAVQDALDDWEYLDGEEREGTLHHLQEVLSDG